MTTADESRYAEFLALAAKLTAVQQLKGITDLAVMAAARTDEIVAAAEAFTGRDFDSTGSRPLSVKQPVPDEDALEPCGFYRQESLPVGLMNYD